MASFQIKNFASIVAGMISRMKATQTALTDFNIGAVNRVMIEAPAIEIDQLYQQMFQGLKQAIPVSTFNSFSFPPLPAVPASGLITVTISQQTADVLISAGTVFNFTGSATSYTVQDDVTITAGNTVGIVLVAAADAGVIGNLPANTAFQSVPVVAGFISATNTAAFTSGTDLETPDEQQQRFAAFIAALPRGTIPAINYGARTTTLVDGNGLITERVITSAVVEPYVTDDTQPIALINLFIHNGVGSTSTDLVAQCQLVIDGYMDSNGNPVPGWKAAGVVCPVAAATEIYVNLNAALTAAPGVASSSLLPLATAAINNYITAIALSINDVTGNPPGGTFEAAVATELVMAIPGVSNFVIGVLTLPPAPTLSEATGGTIAPAEYYVKTTLVNDRGEETTPSLEATGFVGVGTPSAPTLGSTPGGTIGSTTYFVKVAYVNALGQTVASAETSEAVAANNLLTVTSPAAVGDATGYDVYVSTATGTETRQNFTPIAIGTNWTEPTTGLVAGASPPGSTSALGVLVVESPTAAAAGGYNIYASSTSGTETKQNASPIPIGTNWTMPTSGLASGAAPPTTNIADITDVTVLASQKLMPGTTTITPTD